MTAIDGKLNTLMSMVTTIVHFVQFRLQSIRFLNVSSFILQIYKLGKIFIFVILYKTHYHL